MRQEGTAGSKGWGRGHRYGRLQGGVSNNRQSWTANVRPNPHRLRTSNGCPKPGFLPGVCVCVCHFLPGGMLT